MTEKRITLAVIPARGASKRLPRKNIKSLAGKPMIAYAIEAARKVGLIHEVMVSTEDAEIAEVAKRHGALIPFMRPAELASDTATSLSVLQHAVRTYEQQTGLTVDPVVLIQPTSPLIESADILAAIEKLNASGLNCCVAVCQISERPEWMFTLNNDRLKPFLPTPFEEKRSQDLPKLYRVNGAVYAIRRDTLLTKNVIIDPESVAAVVMPRERSVDIDEAADFAMAEAFLTQHQQ